MHNLNKDLTIEVEDKILNVRVAVLIKTKNGYVFEKSKDGFYFTVGGRVKIGESTLEAAKREIKEELDIEVNDFVFQAIYEIFFIAKDGRNVHEYCFFYTATDIDLPNIDNIYFLQMENIEKENIQPKVIKDFILGKNNLKHFISKQF